jgi:putative ABC transport system permease protein
MAHLRSRRDPRIGDELRYHRDRLIQDYVASGMDRAAAERRAFLEFGNVSALEEEVRGVRGRWSDDLKQDLRYALRTLRRSPGFALTAIVSLALGIGANAAVFGLINGVMLQALPVSDPDRLVVIARMRDDIPGSVSYPLFDVFRRDVTSLSGSFVRGMSESTILFRGDDDVVKIDTVSGGFFGVLGIRPTAGRLFGPSDDSPAAAPVAVISDGYWARRFSRSPSALGTTFLLGDRTFTIVGITPRGFRGIRPDRAVDVFLPLELMIGPQQRSSSDFNALTMIGRLKPGATVSQANAEVQTVYAAFVQEQAARAPEKGRAAILRQRAAAIAGEDGVNAFRYEYSRSLFILMGIVVLVLLLACVNLSGLLLARVASREREVAIRLAIGAGRGRLVRQFLTETLVLVVLGAAVGLTGAGWLSTALFRLFIGGREVPMLPVGVDWHVLAYTGAAGALASVILGIAPARSVAGTAIHPAMKHGPAGLSRRFGWSLVVLQYAISMTLVVGATLFIGTLMRLNSVDRGFDSEHVSVVSVRSVTTYDGPRTRAVEAAIIDRLTAIPGVRSASAVQLIPLTGGMWDRTVQIDGYRFGPNESETVGFNVVAPAYFATLHTPLLAGRDFSRLDTATSGKVAIVNESFARQFFGEPTVALGRRVTSVGVAYDIVGVVGDARYKTLRDAVLRTMYTAWTQRDGDQPPAYAYLIRTEGGSTDLPPVLERALRDADPALRLRRVRGYDSLIADSINTERILAALGGVFAALALVVAALGVFGVLAFQVTQRTNEIGVRMALGATSARVMAAVLRDVAVRAFAGIVLGTFASIMAAGVVRGLLFGVTPTEPGVFIVAAAALACVALLAGWLPARRASRVDPLIALRHD